MSLPKSFLLIDRIINKHPEYYQMLKESGMGFYITKKDFMQVKEYVSNLGIDVFHNYAFKRGDSFHYKGLKILIA